MSDDSPAAVTAALPPRSERCQVMADRPEWCRERATLIIYGDDCGARPCSYHEECQGHPVCEFHGADLRATKYPMFPKQGTESPPFVPVRIHTLPEVARA